MKTRRLLPTALAALAVLAVAASSFAQLTEDYRFRGTTVDTSGAAVPEVSVVLRDEASGRRITFKSGKDGAFDRRMIPHGRYAATFEKPGYVAVHQTYDWSASTAQVVEVESKVVLQSEEEKKKTEVESARAELGKKAAKTYEEAYNAFTANDCATTEAKTAELLEMKTGTYEYAVRYLRARCLHKRGDTAAAEAEYRKVIDLKPDLFGAWFDLAGLLESQGSHDEAVKTYGKAAELKPEDPEVHYDIGAILLKSGRFDQALPPLQRALALDAANPAAVKALALAHLGSEKKDFKEALALFRRYLELQPDAADAARIQQYIKDLSAAK